MKKAMRQWQQYRSITHNYETEQQLLPIASEELTKTFQQINQQLNQQHLNINTAICQRIRNKLAIQLNITMNQKLINKENNSKRFNPQKRPPPNNEYADLIIERRPTMTFVKNQRIGDNFIWSWHRNPLNTWQPDEHFRTKILESLDHYSKQLDKYKKECTNAKLIQLATPTQEIYN